MKSEFGGISPSLKIMSSHSGRTMRQAVEIVAFTNLGRGERLGYNFTAVS